MYISSNKGRKFSEQKKKNLDWVKVHKLGPAEVGRLQICAIKVKSQVFVVFCHLLRDGIKSSTSICGPSCPWGIIWLYPYSRCRNRMDRCLLLWLLWPVRVRNVHVHPAYLQNRCYIFNFSRIVQIKPCSAGFAVVIADTKVYFLSGRILMLPSNLRLS